MSSVNKTWLFAGAGAIAVTASLLFSVNVMNPFVPMPLYMVILAWTLSFGFIFVITVG